MTSDQNKEIMARNIKKYMKMKGVNNQQICDALNIKYTTFLDWTKGITYPRMPKVELMANYFGIMKSDLIEDKTEEQRRMEKNNDAIADIVVRLRTDEKCLQATRAICSLDEEQLDVVNQMLSALLK